MPELDSVVVCGRSFSAADLEVIRQIIAAPDSPHRREISRRTCAALGWLRLDGRPKEMSCRVALLRLEKMGLIELPAPRHASFNRKPYCPDATLGPPLWTIPTRVSELQGLSICPVESAAESRLWNEAIARFHYLGYGRLPGAQIRYLVRSSTDLLGAVGFGASAWKVAPRDKWIGWSASQREQRLHLVVNNARFLILPWVRVKNLASWVLGACARRIASDFAERYGYKPVLLETFVEKDRFRGTCYDAANWRYVGDTQGRGKLDRYSKAELPVKKIYVLPLVEEFREVLCS